MSRIRSFAVLICLSTLLAAPLSGQVPEPSPDAEALAGMADMDQKLEGLLEAWKSEQARQPKQRKESKPLVEVRKKIDDFQASLWGLRKVTDLLRTSREDFATALGTPYEQEPLTGYAPLMRAHSQRKSAEAYLVEARMNFERGFLPIRSAEGGDSKEFLVLRGNLTRTMAPYRALFETLQATLEDIQVPTPEGLLPANTISARILSAYRNAHGPKSHQ